MRLSAFIGLDLNVFFYGHQSCAVNSDRKWSREIRRLMVIYIIAFSEGKIWEGTREDPPLEL